MYKYLFLYSVRQRTGGHYIVSFIFFRHSGQRPCVKTAAERASINFSITWYSLFSSLIFLQLAQMGRKPSSFLIFSCSSCSRSLFRYSYINATRAIKKAIYNKTAVRIIALTSPTDDSLCSPHGRKKTKRMSGKRTAKE